MYEDFKDHRDIMLNRQTDMLNIFNRHWAALKNHQKIKIALDVNEQIERLSYQLSHMPIGKIYNRPVFLYKFDQNLFPKRLQEQVERIGEAMAGILRLFCLLNWQVQLWRPLAFTKFLCVRAG